jgi:hypothetical protein
MKQKGFLIVHAQPSPIFEEEFNAWYDTEHVPERLAVPGFETALRYVCTSGSRGYLAVYDTVDAGVFDTEEYLRVSFDRSSPWTKRVTSRARIYRSAGAQIYPGDALTVRAARLYLLRFSGLPADAGDTIVAGMRANYEQRAATLQVRVFAYPTAHGVDFLGMAETRAPIDETLDLRPFGRYADAIDLVNTYVPY